MTTAPISASFPAPLDADGQTRPQNAAEAARQFEALLIAQMLRTARESTGDSLNEGDSSGDTMFDVAGQHLAQVLANSGGLGLSKMIADNLQKR